MLKIRPLLFLSLLAAQPLLAQSNEAFQIRSYAVPPTQQEALRNVLGEAVSLALGLEDRRSAGVSSVGEGQLLVTAPPRVQEDVARFLRDFQPPPSTTLLVEYWIVAGDKRQRGDYAANLQAISPALDALAASAGDISFTLLEHVETRSPSGASTNFLLQPSGGGARGIRGGSIHHQLHYRGGRIDGDLDLSYRGSRLETRVALEPGQFLAVGSSSVPASGDVVADPNQVLFYILRVQPL